MAVSLSEYETTTEDDGLFVVDSAEAARLMKKLRDDYEIMRIMGP